MGTDKLWARGGGTSTGQFNKVFLLLFVHKKKPSSSLGIAIFDLHKNHIPGTVRPNAAPAECAAY
jgi:hypothetical protein